MKFYIFALVLVQLYVSSQGQAPYNESLAKGKMFSMAVAARSDFSDVCLTNLGYTNFTIVQTFNVPCNFSYNLTSTPDNIMCKAFIGYSIQDLVIGISFRGTVGQDQLNDELENFGLVNFYGTNTGQVNQYFKYAFDQLLVNGLEDQIRSINALTGNFYTFYVTGHSLGGSLATLCTGWLSNVYGISLFRLNFYSYGEPRTGNTDFVNWLNPRVYSSYRVVHRYDPVPHSPRLLVPTIVYQHVSSEVWYNNDMTPAFYGNYTITQTDTYNAGSNSIEVCTTDLIAATVADHDFYFGVHITDFALNNCTVV